MFGVLFYRRNFMNSSPVDEIKNRLDIVQIVGSYVKLQKAGANFRALCPFHSEKNPSFFVSPSRQMWHCFGGCGQGGDIFKFIMQIEGVEFGDALRLLAQKAGVELRKERPELKTQRRRLYEICELATRFFEKQLKDSKAGKQAQEYLLSRGIKEESIKKWRLGWSPDAWQGLSDFLVGKGYERQEIGRAGLAVKQEQGSFYDRFRSRIIFPVFDLHSQVIGFGGRIFGQGPEEVAKYVNTPNTLLYDKSRVLYGLDRAKLSIRKTKACLLVEGYTDTILVSQAGFQNVVATSGTALTTYQLNALKRYSENLLTAFDMDLAGDSATKRGIDLARSMGFDIKVLLLPDGSDPADIVSKDTKLFEKLINEARSILDFYFETTLSRTDASTPEGKKTISSILLPVIKRIPNSIERSFWTQKLANLLQVREEDVLEELKKVKVGPELYVQTIGSPQNIAALEKKSRKELLQERALTLAIKFPQHAQLVKDVKEKTGLDKQRLDYLAFKAEVEDINGKEALSEIQFCLAEIQSLEIKDKMAQISRDIKKAEQEKNLRKVQELTKNFTQLVKKVKLS